MSTHIVCDICGRSISGNFVALDVVSLDANRNQRGAAGPPRSFDVCTARDGNDVGCDQFVNRGIQAMKTLARVAAEEREGKLPGGMTRY